MRGFWRFAVGFALGLALSGPNAARADSATEAQLQYELGSELYKQGRYTEAIERFIASHRLVPNPNVVLNVVQTFSYLQRFEEAYNWNETFIELAKDEAQKKDGLTRRSDLGKKVAVVEVTTNPAGAELYVDREELGSVGHSPRRIALTGGSHQIIARLERHEPASASVAAKTGSSTPLALTLSATLGSIRITSMPKGATVREEGAQTALGVTPFETRLPVGQHRLEIVLPGYVNQNKSLDVSRDATANLDISLQRAASSVALLSVRGNVDGAEVWLEGRRVGLTPLTLDSLPPGSLNLEVRAPGRNSVKERVSLESGTATRVNYELVDPKDQPWQGWRYIGYGTGAALFTAGAVVGLLARSSHSSFDSDPSRSTLDRVRSENIAADVLMGAGVVTLGATLTWDLVRAPPAESHASVSMDR